MLSCLIVGCGKIAGGYDRAIGTNENPLTHAGAYKAHGGFRLSGCVDTMGLADEFARKWGFESAYNSIDDIPIGTVYDVVSICSPTDTHVINALKCMRFKPKVIICEKPISFSLHDAKLLKNECEANNVKLLVSYNRRWNSFLNDLVSSIQNDKYGDILHVSGIYTRGLYNNGSHLLDFLSKLFFGRIQICYKGKPVNDGITNDPSVPFCAVGNDVTPIMIGCGNGNHYSIFELRIYTQMGEFDLISSYSYCRYRPVVNSISHFGFKNLQNMSEYKSTDLAGAYKLIIDEAYNLANDNEESQLTCGFSESVSAIQLCDEVNFFNR